MSRVRVVALSCLAILALAPAVADAAPGPLGLDCTAQDGLSVCSGKVRTFDGVPLDTNLVLPGGVAAGLPLIDLSHGWGGSKVGTDELATWARRGYAALSFTARGFNGSCGTPPNRAQPGCDHGWIRLDDTRYEVRDVQHVAGLLADEGVIDGQNVGVTGGSYGGGVSLALAVLRDRIMKPDGTLAPWTSPAKGLPMRIAATAPWIPWSDLVYSLTPNGRTLDYTITGPKDDISPAGVMKASYVSGLFAAGEATGFYAPPGADPDADLTRWYATIGAGEPYDGNPLIADIADEISTHHSAYYLPDTQTPAPAFLASGWTDDLFPVDETIRFYNRTRANHPDADMALMYLDFGHARGQNKPADVALFRRRVEAWMDEHLLGRASADAPSGVEALTQTCPKDAPSGGPFRAATWAALHPGEVRFSDAATQTLTSAGGDPSVGATLDPIGGGGACATVADRPEPGTATWTLPPATGSGYTLLGAPTIVADVAVTGPFAQIAGRLWDVSPDGQQTLVARGVYRPDAQGRQVWQLHPGAWHFAPGHRARLQLLGRDAPYVRPSNGAFSVDVSKLELRLPVADRPDCAQVLPPAAPVVPKGAKLAPDVSRSGARRCR